MGAKYDYKVYYKNGLYVEDFEGNKIERPKVRVSQNMRNSPIEKADKGIKSKRGAIPTD